MFDIITDEEIELNDNKSPIEIIFIDQNGKMIFSYKNQLEHTEELNGEQIPINYHSDILYYFFKKFKICSSQKLYEIRKNNNLMDYIIQLIKEKYLLIINHTYYGIMRKEEDGLDIIIADNGNETKEQLTSLKKIEPILNKKNTRINMWTIKTNKNIEEKEYKYNEIIEATNRKGK